MKRVSLFLLLLLITNFSCKKDSGKCWMCMNAQNKAIWERCDVTEEEMKGMTGPGKACVTYLKN